MATVRDDLTFAVSSGLRLLDELAERTNSANGASDGLPQHISETIELLRQATNDATTEFDRSNSDAARRAAVRNVRFFNQMTWAIHEAVPWLFPPRAPLDLGSAYFLEGMAYALVAKDVHVVPVDTDRYMYSTTSWPFRTLIEQHLGGQVGTSRQPIILFYPSGEVHSTLLHGIFAHELGHALCDRHDLVDRAFTEVQQHADFSALVTQAQLHFEGVLNMSPQRARAEALQLLSDRLEELICDHVALQYLGPSFLFSFATFLLSVSFDEAQDEHPSTTARTQLLLEQARELGWDTVVSDAVPDIWDWLSLVANVSSTTGDPASNFAETMCMAHGSTLREIVRDHLRSTTFDTDEFAGLDAEIQGLLGFGILPAQNEHGDALSPRCILLSAWLYGLRREGGDTSSLPKLVRDKEYQRFVGKAFEMSLLLEAWADA